MRCRAKPTGLDGIRNESVFCHACRVLYYKHTHTASQAHVPQKPTHHTNFGRQLTVRS